MCIIRGLVVVFIVNLVNFYVEKIYMYIFICLLVLIKLYCLFFNKWIGGRLKVNINVVYIFGVRIIFLVL